MSNLLYKKHYYNLIFSLVWSSIAIIVITGQIVFLSIGLLNGIADWEFNGILAIGVGVFGFAISLCLFILIFGCYSYWRIDDNCIINGGLLHKKTMFFKDIIEIDIKRVQVPSYRGLSTPPCLIFKNQKKETIIPIYGLSDREISWIVDYVKTFN